MMSTSSKGLVVHVRRKATTSPVIPSLALRGFSNSPGRHPRTVTPPREDAIVKEGQGLRELKVAKSLVSPVAKKKATSKSSISRMNLVRKCTKASVVALRTTLVSSSTSHSVAVRMVNYVLKVSAVLTDPVAMVPKENVVLTDPVAMVPKANAAPTDPVATARAIVVATVHALKVVSEAMATGTAHGAMATEATETVGMETVATGAVVTVVTVAIVAISAEVDLVAA
jgi:hypothetical protein